jgi:hypothetical protein
VRSTLGLGTGMDGRARCPGRPPAGRRTGDETPARRARPRKARSAAFYLGGDRGGRPYGG